MAKPCGLNCDGHRTISEAHLVEKIAQISKRRIPAVKRALGYALPWDDLIDADAA